MGHLGLHGGGAGGSMVVGLVATWGSMVVGLVATRGSMEVGLGGTWGQGSTK